MKTHKKVLLINPNTIRPPIAPIGLEYVGEYLKQNGIKVFICDLSFNENLIKKIKTFKPDFIGITIRNIDDCSFKSRKFFLPEIKKLVSKIKKITKAPIIAGGVGFSVSPVEILKFLNIDFGIYGDGENAFLKFILKYPDFSKVPNLIYKKNGKYIKNKNEFFNLCFLKPKRILFNNKKYFKEGGMLGIETKRGCPKRCIFCVDYISKGEKLRLRPAKNVTSEIKELLKQGINYFHLCDSEFNIPYSHAVSICNQIIKEKLNNKIFWYCYCSPFNFDYKLAKLMKKAGCKGINFGVDSGNDKILKILGKDYTVRDIIKTADACHKAGLTFMFDLLLGAPGENKNTIIQTINLMKKLKPDVVGTAMGVRIYKNTPIENILKKENKNAFYPQIIGNSDLLRPVFYISSRIGKKIFDFVESLVKNDKRFLFSYGKDKRDYNYNENKVLENAIAKGARGAYWDILRNIR
ncbi:MAG: radical SAM protein [Candidatus Goldbacteria bacterium]|nr:radical SAM protein [Candidatus Goldiibacteriota bacterium]